MDSLAWALDRRRFDRLGLRERRHRERERETHEARAASLKDLQIQCGQGDATTLPESLLGWAAFNAN